MEVRLASIDFQFAVRPPSGEPSLYVERLVGDVKGWVYTVDVDGPDE